MDMFPEFSEIFGCTVYKALAAAMQAEEVRVTSVPVPDMSGWGQPACPRV
jgi:hypothetical protein